MPCYIKITLLDLINPNRKAQKQQINLHQHNRGRSEISRIATRRTHQQMAEIHKHRLTVEYHTLLKTNGWHKKKKQEKQKNKKRAQHQNRESHKNNRL